MFFNNVKPDSKPQATFLRFQQFGWKLDKLPTSYHSLIFEKKVQVGNDQEMAQSDRNSHSINREVGKNLNDT